MTEVGWVPPHVPKELMTTRSQEELEHLREMVRVAQDRKEEALAELKEAQDRYWVRKQSANLALQQLHAYLMRTHRPPVEETGAVQGDDLPSGESGETSEDDPDEHLHRLREVPREPIRSND